jgi:peptide/nickel transport system permease protein
VGRFGFVIQRLIQLVPVLFGITLISFFLIHLIPGDPVAAILGNHYTAQTAAAMRAHLGLDKPLPVQYGIFLGHLLQGDLGDSIYYEQSVASLILERLPNTLWLIAYAAVISVAITIPLALVAALGRNSVFDQGIRATFMVALAMPSFWTGIMLIIVLSIKLHLFPVSGYGTNLPDHLWHMFLPSLTIALGFGAILIRSLRNSLLVVLGADYVDTARAKGLPGRLVLTRHVLRNALLTTVTIFGINIAFLIGTTVIIENVFAIGGIGQLLVSSILQRDYAVVQGITLLLAVLVVGINLLTDVVYTILDPRISYS